MSENNDIYEVAARLFSTSRVANSLSVQNPNAQTHIPLASAYLCQDCNAVGNNSRTCPACASEVLLGLAGILNRDPTATTNEEEEYLSSPALVA